MRKKPSCLSLKSNVDFFVKTYPFGVGVRADVDFPPFNLSGNGRRKKIEGFSRNSARRLRLQLLTQFVGGKEMFSFTFTTPEIFTPDEWRVMLNKWNGVCNYYKWPGVWRVELQTRGTPHLHCVMWLEHFQAADVKEKWVNLVGGFRFPDVACVYTAGLDCKWIMYITGHISKKKKSQLGWRGRQWGVWCREMFSCCELTNVVLSEKQYYQFKRAMRGWLWSKWSKRSKRSCERSGSGLLKGLPGPSKCRSRLESPVWYRIGLSSWWSEKLLNFIQEA